MKKVQLKRGGNLLFCINCIFSFLILAVIVLLFPVGLSEYRITDTLAPVWYFITMTGGVLGASVILLFFIIYLLYHFRNKPAVRKNVYVFILTVIIVQIVIAGTTLFYFKDAFQRPRPSQLYFAEKGFTGEKGKEFLTMPLKEKSRYMRELIESDTIIFKDIYPPILDSWIYESGFSFPSGHSQTAFFLGTIIAFVLFKIHPKKIYFAIPLIWAILVALSRVVIGVHYPVDVTVGALSAMIIAFVVVSSKKVNAIFE